MSSKEELMTQIRYLKDVQGLSLRQIAKKLGICRNVLSRIYSGNWKEPEMIREFMLDSFRDLIAQWYRDCPALKAVQIFERLAARHVAIDYSTVARYTREFRQKKKARVYWPLTFLPGEEGQVDWFFVDHPKLGRCCGFVIILSYSRFLFAHLFPRHAFEFFIEGHLMALRCFGGCPHALRYDNLKSVVLKRQPLTYNPAFLDFAHHFGFEIRLCNVAAGNEKGRVERAIRSLRETFFNAAANHQSLKALNADLHEWVEQKNQTVHRATEAKPADKMKEERLKPLPDGPWHNVIIHPPKKPTKTGLAIFDTNAYSFPDYLGGHEIIVRAFVDRVDLYTTDQQQVASHPRSFDRHKTFINPIHRTVTRLSAPAKRERILAVIRGMDPVMAQFLDAHHSVGEDHYVQSAEIFALLRAHSRAVILSAIRETIASGSPRISSVRALLEPASAQPAGEVNPQNRSILNIDYTPRALEDYEKLSR